jgi:hypothetical protein
MFSSDVRFRRKYFRATATCLFSLWDLGLFERKEKLLSLMAYSME